MNIVERSKRRVIYTILDGLLSTAILLLSIYMFTHILNNEFNQDHASVIFSLLTVARAFQAGLKWEKGKRGAVRLLVAAGIYLIMTVILLIFEMTETVFYILAGLYALEMIIGRVFAVIQSKRWISRILNALPGFVLLYLAIESAIIEMEEKESLILMTIAGTIVLRCLFHIIAISFSQIQLNILMKIIRRSYALEILFGQMMLIASFSYVLMYTEESINDYWDGLWYCFAIVTTIGFGDIVATTIAGRILSVILGIYGIIMVALVTSIIINFYSETKEIQEEEDRAEKAHRDEKRKKKGTKGESKEGTE